MRWCADRLARYPCAVDEAYFQDYCGYGPYDEQYLFHSGVTHCVAIAEKYALRIRSVLVLGAATGQVLGHFEAAFAEVPEGCEISAWAHARIPARYRERIRRADMRQYVPELCGSGRRFDLGFTNALIYLEEPDLAPLLRDCARMCRYFHHDSCTAERTEPGDRYIRLVKPRSWWRAQLKAAGFRATRSPYLWRTE